MHRWRALAASAAALLLAGCGTATRVARMGPLPHHENLVTLVITDDRGVVGRECRDVVAVGPVLGCTLWHPVVVDGTPIRVIKVVRFADTLPSPLTLEIDVHELCHTIAALQPIDDPCHEGNGGVVRAAAGR
jgi:hypothetical protein